VREAQEQHDILNRKWKPLLHSKSIVRLSLDLYRADVRLFIRRFPNWDEEVKTH